MNKSNTDSGGEETRGMPEIPMGFKVLFVLSLLEIVAALMGWLPSGWRAPHAYEPEPIPNEVHWMHTENGDEWVVTGWNVEITRIKNEEARRD